MSKDHQEYDLTANIQEVLSLIHTKGGGSGDNDDEPDEEERETIHVYPVEGGGILFTRTPIIEDDDLETSPLPTRPAPQPTSDTGSGIMVFGVFITLLCIMGLMVQWDFMLNPFTVTATLVAKSQQLTLQGTLALGRLLSPITVSQSATTPTTGHGHQDARAATGSITLYNGQSTQVFVPAGTTLTGNSGEQIVTDQDASIPPASQTIPPTFGQTTVSAHVKDPGARGNVPTGDINQSCCATSILAQNTAPFHGGQDERDFQTVAKGDITNAASPLKATLAQSVQGALQGQLKDNEAFVTPSCTTTTTSDHQPGEEATTVKVTVLETCSAVAYNAQELTDKVTQLLTNQAAKKVGSGYSLLENPHITVTGATTTKQVMLSFRSTSQWVYGISNAQQHHIKKIIAGKNTQSTLQVLRSLPGIESASLQFSGFGDASRLPKNISNVHLMIYTAA